MSEINILLSGFLYSSAVLTLFISIYSFTAKKSTVAVTFSLLCLSFAFYSFGYAMELYSTVLNQMLFWNQIQYIGIPFLPSLWLIIALQYSNHGKYLTPAASLLILAVPLATFLLRLTNSYHHLYYADVRLETGGLFPVIILEKGPWYLVQGLYMTLCIFLSAWLYLRRYKTHSSFVRNQCVTMFIASLLPWFALLANLLNISPHGIDLIPFSGAVSCILFLLVLFRFQFLDLKPLARDKVFESSDDGIIILDTRYDIIDFNRRASEIIPELKPDACNKSVGSVLEGNAKALEAILDPGECRLVITHDNITNHYNVRKSEIHSKNGLAIGLAITITDITNYVETMEKLDYLASRDELTGLYNRRQFFKCGAYELERAKRYRHALSLIILDVDFYKSINDEYGHIAGDETLKAISGICTQSLRSVDIIGRYGGEEFLIFLPETGLKEALQTAERIRSNIELAEISYQNEIIKVTASFGVTGLDHVNDETIDSFLKNADKALYRSKSGGRNRVMSEMLSAGT